MDSNSRYDELTELSHERILNQSEIDELGSLALTLNRQNPLLPAKAAVVAKVIILNKKREMLVLWRSDKTPRPGRADFPGGGVDFGENPVDGAIREAREEAGLDIQHVQMAEAYGFVHQDEFYILLGYVGFVERDDVVLSWEHDRFAWMSIDDALQMSDWQERHLRILQAARRFV
jgi:8-oxo-dGTP diphosphatase